MLVSSSSQILSQICLWPRANTILTDRFNCFMTFAKLMTFMSPPPNYLHFPASPSTTYPLFGTTFKIMSGQSPLKFSFPVQPKKTFCHSLTPVLSVIIFSVLPVLVFLDQDQNTFENEKSFSLHNFIHYFIFSS